MRVFVGLTSFNAFALEGGVFCSGAFIAPNYLVPFRRNPPEVFQLTQLNQ